VVGPYMVVGYQLEVANVVFNGRRDCHIPSSCHVAPMHGMTPCCRTAWHCSGPGEWPVAWRCTVAAELLPVSKSCWYLMRRPQLAPRVIMTASTHKSGRYLGNTWVHLGNVQTFLYLLLMAHKRSRYVCFSGAQCHMVAPELTCWAQSCGTRDGSEAPQSREEGLRSYWAHGSTRALSLGEQGSGATRLVAACGCSPRP
jgi:hypothetical protein